MFSKRWRRQAWAWGIFLAFGLISTVFSPFPVRSLMGHEITADGLLYWLLIAGFMLTNGLILQQYPHLFHWQLRGILMGTTLVAFSMYPQLINWKLDYTIHSGQLWPDTDHVLATAIYRNQQPIGLYSHRGYASFSLSMASVLSLAALQNRWVSSRIAFSLMVLYAVTLSLAKVRGAMLAMLAGWFWLAVTSRQHRSTRLMLITFSLIGGLSFTWATMERDVRDAELYAQTPLGVIIKHFTSDRVFLWHKARLAFLERPWIGWGLNGYSIADATKLCPEGAEPVYLSDYYVVCQDRLSQIIEVPTEAIKAHNLLLDWIVSIGGSGIISYIFLIKVSIPSGEKIQGFALGILVCYQVYGLTWFDCAQISHLGWWGLTAPELKLNAKQSSDQSFIHS